MEVENSIFNFGGADRNILVVTEFLFICLINTIQYLYEDSNFEEHISRS